MNSKKALSVLLLIFGESLIIAGFIVLGKGLDGKILLLDIIVSSIIFNLFFGSMAFPWIDLKDKSQKAVGNIGIKMVFTLIYIFFAIAIMVYFIVDKPSHVHAQFLAQGILLFFLILGLYFGISASDKVEEVYYDEKRNRGNLDDLKSATKEVQLKLESMKTIPVGILNKVNSLQENLRFISPSNNDISLELEKKYLVEIRKMSDYLYDLSPNFEAIEESINNCERIYKERKQVYSN